MYVVTRKVNQGVVIGDDIEIVILEARDDRIRLGVRTPRYMAVRRKEFLELEQPILEGNSSIQEEGS